MKVRSERLYSFFNIERTHHLGMAQVEGEVRLATIFRTNRPPEPIGFALDPYISGVRVHVKVDTPPAARTRPLNRTIK